VSAALALVVPLILMSVSLYALHRRVDVFAALTDGAKDGVTTVLKILPNLVGLLTAVYMLRASGALDALASACKPVLTLFGIPPETVPLMFIRPVSGSGALAVGSELINAHGADSLVGRTAAIMLGSTETTFYTIAVYFGSVGVKKTRYAIPAALIADVTGFFVASLTARLLY
jgi:spore maturation protein B